MNERVWMIEEIKTKYGLDAPDVFEAMMQVPREKFVPSSERSDAYKDMSVPIGHGQTISQPLTVAFMINLLRLKKEDVVLEIGTGSGYSAAVSSLLCQHVYSVERIPKLAREAADRLKNLNFENISVKDGNGEEGWPEHAPYDAIVVTAEIEGEVPQLLLDQLKDGGVLVSPVDEVMTKFNKKGDMVVKEEHGYFKFVPFIKTKK